MPKFYFHVREQDRMVKDDEGSDLADFEAAKLEAEEAARELLSDEIEHDNPIHHREIVVCDEGGKVILTVNMAATIKLAETESTEKEC